MNYHVEVHSRDRQVEHYIVQNAETDEQAREWMTEFYAERGLALAPNLEALPDDQHYYLFNVTELKDDRVVYISGEYRSQFPV